jgi:hypothetical protein
MNWVLRRLREPSTWRGLVWLATVAGLSLRPDQAEAIVTAGMALAGLLGVFLADEPKTVKIELSPIDLQGRPEPHLVGVDATTVRDADELRRPVPSEYRPGVGEANNPASPVGWGDRD